MSFIGPNLLNSGAMKTGVTSSTSVKKGSVSAPVQSHQRVGLRASNRYGTQMTSAPTISPIASPLSWSPIHFDSVCVESP